MKYFITYSDEKFKKQRSFALKMAKLRGGFDEVVGYDRSGIDNTFYDSNKHILEQMRGGGYWLWKPYYISRTLERISYGDYLFYSDAGAFFIKSANILIAELNKRDQDVMGFELPLIERQWSKKELFRSMNCDADEYADTNQIMASYILVKKTAFSIAFFDEYLKYACNDINITDKYDDAVSQDTCFIDHRHDQSIFSLLYKKYKLKPFKDPSQYGDWPWGYSGFKYLESKSNEMLLLDNGRLFRANGHKEDYSLVIFHSRKSNPIVGLLKYNMKKFLHEIRLQK